MNDSLSSLIVFLKNLERVYGYKRRRLKYMKMASVHNELRIMRDNFNELWDRDGKDFRLKSNNISEKALRILIGMFGAHEEADAILSADRAIADFDRTFFRAILSERIASSTASMNLYNIFYGEGDTTIEKLVKKQIPYLERYIPTLINIDASRFDRLRFSIKDIENIKGFIEMFDEIADNFSWDIRLYREFSRDFKRLYKEAVSLNIVGYGEISTVMQLAGGSFLNESFELERLDDSGWVWKRMPPIYTIEEVREFERIYMEYREIVDKKIGIPVPEQKIRFFSGNNLFTVYAGQRRANPDFICNKVIKGLDTENSIKLFSMILGELNKVYQFNMSGGDIKVGFDGQLSNWVLVSEDGSINSVSDRDTFIYIDTSSPLYRVNGEEQINTEIFIKNAPSFLRPVIRKFFLHEVLDRYYEIRSVIVDIIANLHKEKRVDLIDHLIPVANRFLKENRISDTEITRKEVDKYYSSDAFIWKFFQFCRRLDRFITERIFRKKYSYRLPGKVER